MKNKLSKKDISEEAIRRYRWIDPIGNRWVEVVIHKPQYLWFHSKGSTHRVQDIAGEVVVVPSPGNFGCYIQYTPNHQDVPVRF